MVDPNEWRLRPNEETVLVRVIRTSIYNMDVPKSVLTTPMRPSMWEFWSEVEPLIADEVEDYWVFGLAHPDLVWRELPDSRSLDDPTQYPQCQGDTPDFQPCLNIPSRRMFPYGVPAIPENLGWFCETCQSVIADLSRRDNG
jgi:hypothetical protein